MQCRWAHGVATIWTEIFQAWDMGIRSDAPAEHRHLIPCRITGGSPESVNENLSGVNSLLSGEPGIDAVRLQPSGEPHLPPVLAKQMLTPWNDISRHASEPLTVEERESFLGDPRPLKTLHSVP